MYHSIYTGNIVTISEPFTVTIIDPCDRPIGLAASNVINQEYTITAVVENYQVPVFTSDPAWCAITYSFTITDSSGNTAVTFDDDPAVREFTFDYSADLDLCGISSINYETTV